MKRGKSIVLASISLVLFSNLVIATDANAIFGLSACEKLKSRVLSEEKIGQDLWNSFHADSLQNDKSSGTQWNEQINNDLIVLFKSDDKVFTDMLNHNSCFTSAQVAYLRKESLLTTNWINALNQALANVQKGTSIWKHTSANGIYDSYSEIYKTLKTIK